MLVPVIRAMRAEFGEERVSEIIAATIRRIARSQGEAVRNRLPMTGLPGARRWLQDRFLADGSLTADVREATERRWALDVTRCLFEV